MSLTDFSQILWFITRFDLRIFNQDLDIREQSNMVGVVQSASLAVMSLTIHGMTKLGVSPVLGFSCIVNFSMNRALPPAHSGEEKEREKKI